MLAGQGEHELALGQRPMRARHKVELPMDMHHGPQGRNNAEDAEFELIVG